MRAHVKREVVYTPFEKEVVHELTTPIQCGTKQVKIRPSSNDFWSKKALTTTGKKKYGQN